MALSTQLQEGLAQAERRTVNNQTLTLNVCFNYGGRWDILQAMRSCLKQHPGLSPDELSEELLTPYLSMSYAPEPDLFIRTGGEQRISNFLLWQIAYTEFYFTTTLWPDFRKENLWEAIVDSDPAANPSHKANS